MIMACGLTLAELAQHLGMPVHAPSPQPSLITQPGPSKATSHHHLTARIAQAFGHCDNPDGANLSDIERLMGVAMQTAWGYLDTLHGEGLVVRVKAEGVRGTRFFVDPKHAQAWVDSHAKAVAQVPAGPPAEAPAKQPAVLPVEPSAISASPAPATPKPRIEAGRKNITYSSPKPPAEVKPQGEAKRTEKTVEVLDTLKRPNNRIEAAPPLPPDPRYPSFSSMPPGIDPRTGKAWEGRA